MLNLLNPIKIFTLMNFNLFGYMFLLLAVCFSLPLLIYFDLISGGISSVPVMRVEKPGVADFSPVFKREEQKQQKREVFVRLLATAVGSVNLALIDVDGQVKTVRVGSEVGGYRVAHIDRNYIILSTGEEKKAIGFSFAGVEAKTTEPKVIAQGETQVLQAVVQRREIESVTADPGVMFRQIRLVPYVQDGRTTGFLFEWVDPQSMFSRVGIVPGDVLVSINNQQIRSGEDAFRILQVLRNESSFRIGLIRGGRPVELLVRVE
jgi:general secretion pathway protein C